MCLCSSLWPLGNTTCSCNYSSEGNKAFPAVPVCSLWPLGRDQWTPVASQTSVTRSHSEGIRHLSINLTLFSTNNMKKKARSCKHNNKTCNMQELSQRMGKTFLAWGINPAPSLTHLFLLPVISTTGARNLVDFNSGLAVGGIEMHKVHLRKARNVNGRSNSHRLFHGPSRPPPPPLYSLPLILQGTVFAGCRSPDPHTTSSKCGLVVCSSGIQTF